MKFLIKIIFLFSSLLCGLVSCRDSKEITFWSLIDRNTVLVYESSKPVLIKDALIDSVLRVSSALGYVVGLQSISKNDYEFIYIVKVANGFENWDIVKKASVRLLNGFSIYELRRNGKIDLVWANLDGYVALSRSPLLIENAIRIYGTAPLKNFKTQHPQLFRFATLKADAGNVWVSYNQISKTSIPLFGTMQKIPLFRNLASASVLDIAKTGEQISLSGFTLDSLEKDWGLFRFQNQSPVKIEVMRFVPNTTKAFIHYGLSNADALITGDPDEPQKSDLRDEIGVCVLDNNKHVVILKVKENYAHDKFDYEESYAGYDIRSVPDDALTESVKALLPEEKFTHLMFKDDYVFLSVNVAELKLVIDAIEAAETWGRSVGFQQFFNTCLQEGNVSIFYTASALLGDRISEEWKPILDSLRLSSTSWGSIQFNSLGNHFFTSANFQLKSATKVVPSKPDRKSYSLSNNLAVSYLVKNYADGTNELLVQDSTFKVYLFSKTGGVQWMYALHERMEQVQQLDYFKNGKLQYIITTASYVYLIDRLGRDVDGFPKKKNLQARFSEVVDYDKSRNYRLLIASGDKDIYILDKTMQELDGWAPKTLNARIRYAPQHYRIGGKDYFVVITEDGQLHVLNRKGEYEKGYPLSIPKTSSGDYYLEAGNSLATSAVFFISRDGVVHKIPLDGKSSNESLVRGNKSTFLLVVASGKPDFYFFRIDLDKVAVFDRANQLVFEKQNPGSPYLKPRVVKSPDGVVYFCLYDEEQNLSYFFNSKGDAIINGPIESTLPPVFEINQKLKQVSVFSIYNNSITNTPIN
ncbi:MAG: hypothetical protein KF763_20515 [Cyclobacteriaceae bacterium]|nr:hypothetical protein [Cyclobacteriaceae bacterium]